MNFNSFGRPVVKGPMANFNEGYKFSFDPIIKGEIVTANQIANEFDKKDKRKKKNKHKIIKKDRDNKTQLLSASEEKHKEEEDEVYLEDVWEEILITSVEDSINAVDYILGCKQPVSVICCGDKLGDAEGKIAVLVIAAEGKSWLYHLCKSTVDFMEAGKLKQLFFDCELMKIFHDVTWTSAVLFKQYEIVLDGTKVFDTKVVLQMGMLDINDRDNLRLVGFMPARWTQEDSQVDCSKWTQSPLDKGLVDKLVERGKALLEFYKVFQQKMLALPKKEIYMAVNRYVDMIKVMEMRKQYMISKTSNKFYRSTKKTRIKHKKGHGENLMECNFGERIEKKAIPEHVVDEHEDTDIDLIWSDATPTNLKLLSTLGDLRDHSEELLLELAAGSADAEDETELCIQDQGRERVDTLFISPAPNFRDKIEKPPGPSSLWPVAPEPASEYDHLHLDPNYFFLGAPSSVMKSHAATILQRVRRKALCHKDGRKVEFLSPDRAACVIRRERCTLPDGSTYELTSTWIPDPNFKETKEQPSQTEENVTKTETETQCEIIKLFV